MDDASTTITPEVHLSTGGRSQRINYLPEKLQQAELLLAYAAEIGVEIDQKLRTAVMDARLADTDGKWTTAIAADLLEAVTVLSIKLRPVTVESVRLCPNSSEAKSLIRLYRRIAVVLAALIVPFSFVTFVAGALAKTISQDLDSANKLAVIIASAEDADATPAQSQKERAATIQTLQEFAANTRALYAHGKQLDYIVFNTIEDPYAREKTDANNRKDNLELPPDLTHLVGVATKRIAVYQGVRYFAQTVQGTVTTIYGACSACVLPVLYALLGSCAFMLREFEQQTRTRTLTRSFGHIAHFIVAAISGAVIGLFNNVSSDQGGPTTPFNFGQGSLVSPLAMAFLVGYAVDVFFSFLEGIIQSFSRGRVAAAPAPQSSPNLTPR
jgi:hypothetical protein